MARSRLFKASNGSGIILSFLLISILIQLYSHYKLCFLFKVVANKDFGRPRKWILTYQICNAVVLDHLFQF